VRGCGSDINPHTTKLPHEPTTIHMELLLLAIFLSTVLASIVAFWLGRRLRVRSGLPLKARVVYSDTGGWEKVEKPLFSRRYLLTGKPDYLVDGDGARIPIEVKPNRVASQPRMSDTLQLAAYGLLVEEAFGTPPPYGLLKYRDTVFRVEFTQELRAQLLQVLNEMQGNLSAEDVARSHGDPDRCRACGYRAECGQALE
jgi:CRISPR-associated exonuclease Cas4